MGAVESKQEDLHISKEKFSPSSASPSKGRPEQPASPSYPGISQGWFSQTQTSGQRRSLKLLKSLEKDAVLCHTKSKYQDIMIFESVHYGKVLVTNGTIEITAKDEFAYHEMLVHLPIFSHPQPKNVLVIGGGSGCAVREVCRHEGVEKISMIEADPKMIEVSKKYLADIAPETVWQDTRLAILSEDAVAHLEKVASEDSGMRYDMIIVNVQESLGVTSKLCKHVYEALNEGGIVCTPGGCFWSNEDGIKELIVACAEVFDSVEYFSTPLPSHPSGEMGFIICQKGGTSPPLSQTPLRKPDHELRSHLKWYNGDMHKAAFALPNQWKAQVYPLIGRDLAAEDEEDDVAEEEMERCFLKQCTIM